MFGPKLLMWIFVVELALSFGQYFNLSEIISDSLNWITEKISESCLFIENPDIALNQSLRKFIIGQDHAIVTILNLWTVWKMNIGEREPLVLVFTGDTGVGKTETSYRTAQTIFAKRDSNGDSPVLNLRGESYSKNSEAGKLGVEEVQKQILFALVEYISKCRGQGIVVFDEVQKVVDGALDILLPALEKRGALNVFSNTTWAPRNIRYSTENIIFIFTTDSGGEIIRKLILNYNDRDNVPHNVLQSSLISDLENGWGQPIVKFVKEVVPFLPLGTRQMEDIARQLISQYAARFRGKYWLDLVVDDNVVALIANSPSLYVKYSAKLKGPNDEPERIATFYNSKLGARGLENGADGPLRKLKILINRAAQSTSWNAAKVMHVGMMSSALYSLWSIDAQKEKRLYFQWCTYDGSMLPKQCLVNGDQQQCLSGTPPQDAKEGFIPWLGVNLILSTSPICETVLIDKL